jgi:hypothetical protein
MILGKQLDGVWHTGIVVFGKEYFFGGDTGITCCSPVSLDFLLIFIRLNVVNKKKVFKSQFY